MNYYREKFNRWVQMCHIHNPDFEAWLIGSLMEAENLVKEKNKKINLLLVELKKESIRKRKKNIK